MDRYRNAAVKIGDAVIGQITQMSVTDSANVVYPMDSGSAWNRAVTMDNSVKRVSFTTQAVAAVFGAIPFTGQALSGAGAVVYLAKFTPNGMIAATAGVSFTGALGLVVVKSLNAGRGQLATVTCEITFVSADGDTDPVVKATGVAMPAYTASEMWVLEGNGGTNGEQSFTLATGLNVIADAGGDDVYPTLAFIDAPAQATATLVQRNMGAFGPTSAIDTITLRAASHAGVRGEDQITFTFNSTMELVSDISPDTTYQCYPVYDGSHAPVVVGLPAA